MSGLNTPRETVDIRLVEGGSLTVPLEAIECPGGGCPCRVSADAVQMPSSPSASVVSGPVPELRESKPESTEGEGGGKRRSRRKSKGKQPAAGQQSGGGSAKKKDEAPRSEDAQAASGTGSTGRRRRRRRPSPRSDDNTGA